MSLSRLAHFTMLPELELLGFHRRSKSSILIKAKKTSEFEVCPRCAKKCSSVYDHREVTVKDAPFRNKHVFLSIRKRRFFCKGCAKVFMEPISGISKSKRYTQRFKSHVLWACENFTDLKSVKRQSACSYGMLYSSLYEQLELNRRMHAHPSWPKVIGIDDVLLYQRLKPFINIESKKQYTPRFDERDSGAFEPIN